MLLNLQARLHSRHRPDLPSTGQQDPNTPSRSKFFPGCLGSLLVPTRNCPSSFLGLRPSTSESVALPLTPFFAALTAPYTSSCTGSSRTYSNDELDDGATSCTLHSDPQDAPVRITHLRPSSLRGTPLYVPDEPWSWISGRDIKSRRVVREICATDTYSLSVMSGQVDGVTITYLNKSWSNVSQQSWKGFFSELALYKSSSYLRPLQGDVVPRLLSVQVDTTSVSLIMELPHHSFWIEASEEMPLVLRERCITALRKIHLKGVLHSNLELRHILIGGDGRVTIMNFQDGRARMPNSQLHINQAENWEFDRERQRLEDILSASTVAKDGADESDLQRTVHRASLAVQSRGYRDPDPTPTFYSESSSTRVPARFVVPGQTERQLKEAVQTFLEALGHIGQNRSDDLVDPSSALANLTTGDMPVERDIETAVSAVPGLTAITTRKRKSLSDHDLRTPPSKRAKPHISIAPDRPLDHTTQNRRTWAGKSSERKSNRFISADSSSDDTSGPQTSNISAQASLQTMTRGLDRTGEKNKSLIVVGQGTSGMLHALGGDFLQLTKGNQRYRSLSSGEFLRRRASTAGKPTAIKSILKPARPAPTPNDARLSDELDTLIDNAIAHAMQSEDRALPSEPPESLRRSKFAMEAVRFRKLFDLDKHFHKRFSGRAVLAGGVKVGFSVPSITEARKLSSKVNGLQMRRPFHKRLLRSPPPLVVAGKKGQIPTGTRR